MTVKANKVRLMDWGHVHYQEAWQKQEAVHGDVLRGADSTLIFCSHPHVYSLGSQTQESNLLISKDECESRGIELVSTDRGGDITYHGPGQIVGYPIFRLADFPCGQDLHEFLRAIEEVLILALEPFGIKGCRVEGKTGAWVGDKKVASIGFKCSRWITLHGFALNVSTDLEYFNLINPCGLASDDMTSLEKLLGKAPDEQAVKEALTSAFTAVFASSLISD